MYDDRFRIAYIIWLVASVLVVVSFMFVSKYNEYKAEQENELANSTTEEVITTYETTVTNESSVYNTVIDST